MCNVFAVFVSLMLSAFGVAQSGSSSAQKAGTQSPAAQAPATAAPQEPTATIVTNMGEIHCTLFPDKAPLTVANFIGLATGTKDWTNPKTKKVMHHVPLYDGTTFHRVIPNFMIQGGDPIGNGTGDPGYSFKDEFTDDLKFDRPGRLAMANSGPNTNGSQFFITEVPTPHLDGHHTIFGQCEDLDLVMKIARVAADQDSNKPLNAVIIQTIKIVDPRKPAPKPSATHKPATTTHKSTTAPKKTTPQ